MTCILRSTSTGTTQYYETTSCTTTATTATTRTTTWTPRHNQTPQSGPRDVEVNTSVRILCVCVRSSMATANYGRWNNGALQTTAIKRDINHRLVKLPPQKHLCVLRERGEGARWKLPTIGSNGTSQIIAHQARVLKVESNAMPHDSHKGAHNFPQLCTWEE